METFFLDSSIPWKGNSIWLKRKSSSPSNDKLSKLKAHTINKFEQYRHLTKLNFHLVHLNDVLRKREDNILSPAHVNALHSTVFKVHSQVTKNTIITFLNFSRLCF